MVNGRTHNEIVEYPRCGILFFFFLFNEEDFWLSVPWDYFSSRKGRRDSDMRSPRDAEERGSVNE